MKKCSIKKCNNKHVAKGYCFSHYRKYTVSGFVASTFNNMKRRTEGRGKSRTKHIYSGLSLIDRKKFTDFTRNSKVFMLLYKEWINCDCDLRLRPTINRINSKKGYTEENMEWVTYSMNSSMAHVSKKFNHNAAKNVAYKLLGVKTNGNKKNR